MEPRKPPERLPEKPRRGLVLVITGEGKGKTASVFGSYGWSGEAIRTVQDILTSMRIKVSPEPIKVRMTPNEQELQACVDFGRKFAEIVGA